MEEEGVGSKKKFLTHPFHSMRNQIHIPHIRRKEIMAMGISSLRIAYFVGMALCWDDVGPTDDGEMTAARFAAADVDNFVCPKLMR